MLTNNSTPTTGAFVTSTIITPTGTDTIILYDDGTHNDIAANDGTYTNTYANTSVSGSYEIIARAYGEINSQPFAREASRIIWVEQFPDLTLSSSDITFSNDTPTQGEGVTVNATIHNIGDIGATDTTVFFYDGLPSEAGTLIGSKTINHIPAGGSEGVFIIWLATNGTHTIQVIISPYNSFLEKDYDNNSASKEIFVSSVDLSTSDISFEPSCPTSGEMATITVIVYNTGTIQADSVVVSFFMGNPLGTGTEIGSQTIITIPANGSKTAQLVWNTSGYTGVIPIYVWIDAQNKILEANEENNLNYNSMYIQEVDTSSPTVNITNPANGSIVSGIVKVDVTAIDNVGITKVAFCIDSDLKHTDITSPYQYSWDTTNYSNGSRTIKVIAYDPSNLIGSESITVTVNNSLPDTTPPGTITDLGIATIISTSITLIWTAPGDDGYVGTATAYDIRYATFTITEDNWNLATQCPDTPTPQPAGATETFTVTNLLSNTTYYFAIKAKDDVGLWSALSNIATATIQAGTIIGTVTDQYEIPLTGVRIEVLQDGKIKGDATTNSSGVYIISNFGVGTFTITARKLNYRIEKKITTLTEGVVTHVDFEMVSVQGSLIEHFPLQIDNLWKYRREVMIDEEYGTFSLTSKIIGTANISGIDTYIMKKEEIEEGKSFIGTDYLSEVEGELRKYAYGTVSGVGPHYSPPKAKGCYYIYQGKRFNSTKEILDYVRGQISIPISVALSPLSEATSTIKICNPPQKLLKFPLTVGDFWISYPSELGTFSRQVVDVETVVVPAGTFTAYKIEILHPMANITWVNWYSIVGLVKSYIKVENIEKWSAEGEYLGTFDSWNIYELIDTILINSPDKPATISIPTQYGTLTVEFDSEVIDRLYYVKIKPMEEKPTNLPPGLVSIPNSIYDINLYN